MISFELDEDVLAVQETVRKFAESELREGMREAETAGGVSDAIVTRYRELGLSTLELPEQHGGLDLGMITKVIVEEELAFGDAGMAAAIDRGGLAAYALLELGTDAQKKQHLTEGQNGTVAFWEPGQRQSLGDPETTVTEDGGGFRINGKKCLVSNAGLVDWYVVFGTVDSSRGWEGVRALLVPKDAPGLTIGEPDEKVGLWALRTATLTLEDVHVPKENLLSGSASVREGAERLMNRVDLVNAARSVGLARAAYEYSVGYAQERQAFGSPIAHHQAVAFMLADMSILVDSARVMLWQAAFLVDKGENARKEVAQALVQANTVTSKITIDAVQVLGGAGFIRDYPVEKWMRDARALSLLSGTDEAQNLLIADAIMAA
ncbi:MAG: acyl-CoA dehydrogenase family protein [Deltaproteobacteria bacterium]|nr:acyl-CoA dehydrogenase family protein [Deltaproteobacteria bacterium]